ncbi:MAG TPA: glutathione S-transferase family protein [Candidatus Limnocylindrales bacterium]|nr:glutathione S-transferase family protein [Candidatus Limnocylindrales bacterium]
MKIYTDAVGAPNPRKLRVFCAEKGISIPHQVVDLMSGENRQPEFAKKNPMMGLPVLELDDGSYLSESLSIMEYLEELHPDPPMIGTNPVERARTREAERICELGVMASIGTIFQNTSPFFAGRIKQSADAAENARGRLAQVLAVVDARIGSQPFVAGSRPTIADCTLIAACGFAGFAGVELDPKLENLARWHADFQKRPSASA